MIIQHGVHHKKLFGIKLKIKAPDFHKVFGSTTTLPADFNLDAGQTNFNQNASNTIFGTPAQPEGCTGMTQSDICTDADRIMYSPWYTYNKTCTIEGQLPGQPCEMVDSLNSTIVYGLQALGESTDAQALNHRRGQVYSVKPLNGSLFQGIISAMSTGQGSVSFAADWYESFENPVNGIVPPPSGQTSGHNWKICGLKTIQGVPYLIAKPWIGAGWGANGFCYFSESIINSLDGQAFTLAKATSQNAQVVRYTVIGTLITYLQRLLSWYQQQQIAGIQEIMTPEQTLYTEAKNSLGKHMTLDNAVPAETGCAEAVSAVLSLAGVSDGTAGIAGTASLYEWLVASRRFVKIDAPEEGAILISPTGSGNGSIEGHTGIFGAYNVAFPNDFGIMSNDSATGKFLESWSWERWQAYYCQAGGLPAHMFRLVDNA